VAATIFWMKARGGWREKHDLNLSADPLDRLTDAQLNWFIQHAEEAAEAETEEATKPES
jgi:hypothetical protein